MNYRTWHWRQQGLDGRLVGLAPADVLAQTGWARSVAGAGPYLSLYARTGIRRPAIDLAVKNLELHELPSARGCTYVVPAAHFALALECARALGDGGDMATALKLGVTVREIDQLEGAIARALKGGPLDPAEITKACGDKVRSLGEAGKKKGLGSTLPLALGHLQTQAIIRRVPTNGRLDNQRYRYALWNLPLPTRPAEEVFVDLARLYFGWTGPTTTAEFQWFSGLSQTKAKAAIAPLGLAQLEDGRWIFPKDRDPCLAAQADQRVALVSSLDALFLLRRNVTDFVDPADQARQVRGEKQLYALGGLTDLMFHAILRGGRLIGLWEYDPGTQSIAWMSFVKKDKAIGQAVEATEAMIRAELEDARSFSLDSPKSRQPRIDWLRAQ